MPMTWGQRFFFQGGDEMPQDCARIRYRYVAAAVCVLLNFIIARPGALSANDERAAELPSATQAATSPAISFQSEVKSLLIAERPHTSSSRSKGQSEAEHASRNDLRVQVVSEGTSSRAARKTATAALPLNKLTPEGRTKVQQLVSSAAIFRELPTLAFEVDPSVYQYFLMHPDMAVSIWRAMGVSEFKMWQTGPVGYEADTGDGTVGIIDVLHRSSSDSVVICNGVFKSPLLVRPIKANALMHLQTEYHANQEGRKFVQHKLKLFVDFPSTTVETAAKIVTPVTNVIVDRNFQEVSLFLHMMSLGMVKRPDWVMQIAGRLEGVLEPSKMEFVNLTNSVHSAALQAAQDLPVPGEGKSVVGNEVPADTSATPKRVANVPRSSAQQ
jgi:hypothetical protein